MSKPCLQTHPDTTKARKEYYDRFCDRKIFTPTLQVEIDCFWAEEMDKAIWKALQSYRKEVIEEIKGKIKNYDKNPKIGERQVCIQCKKRILNNLK